MLAYPLDLSFKVVTFGSRIRVADASGNPVAFVRKKKFKMKEDVMVYENEDQNTVLFRIKADRMLDFNASYAITTPDGRAVGSVGRDGMRSLWKTAYGVVDATGRRVGGIHEENPWIKVMDGLFEIIPFADSLGGLFFHPAYLVDLRGENVLRVRKRAALLEGKFGMEKLGEFTEDEEKLLLASVIMMVLLERDRG